MHNLLLFDRNQQPLSAEVLEGIFQSVVGFSKVRRDAPTGTLVEAQFAKDGDSTTVRLNSTSETISIAGTSDAAFQAAWLLQEHWPLPLRIVDTDYTFDLVVNDFRSMEEFQMAVDDARAG